MGDHIIIKDVDLLYGHLFQIDLLNENNNAQYRVFIEKEKIKNMMKEAEDRSLKK